jgi:hypothetical protein
MTAAAKGGTPNMIRTLAAASVLLLASQAIPARAGTLEIYEASVGPGQMRTLTGPVTNALVDLDYAPISAEGGKLYGMSEVEIQATGNLILSPTGFACQASGCLYSPSPFVAGKKIRVTAGNDLAGESTASANLLTIGVTGSSGYVVLVRGEYLDATATGAQVGSARTLDAAPLVTVPEPDPTLVVATACLLIALFERFATKTKRARRT